MRESETDTQLDIFGAETPVEDLPEPEPGDSQVQDDDPWPDDCYQPTT